MALRIPIPAATLAAGIDSLFVLGVSASASPSGTADAFADLLDAHHYTDGLEFLRVGTPTNNTADARRLQSDGREHDASFAIEVASDPATLDANANARRLGAALGLAPIACRAVLGHVARAAETHDATAAA